MGKMVMLLRASSKKEKRFLYISYLLDVFLISIVLMIVKLLEETSFDLSASDAGQSAMMATGIILVAVMIIVFFLWLIAMEFKGLYDSRAVFNRNVKLMGCPGRKLMMLYILEMLYMQIPCVAGGCVLGAAVYHFYAVGNSEVIVWMKPGILVAAIVIHMRILFLTVAIVGRQCVRQSAVTEQRGGYVRKEKRPVSIIVQLIIVAAAVFVIQGVCRKMETLFSATDALVYTQALKLAYMAVVALGFAPVMRLVFAIADAIGKRAGAFHFVISLKLTKSYWGRFLVMTFLIIFSGAFFSGLYALFGTTRTSADNLSRESIHYQSYYIFNQTEARGADERDDEAFYTLRYRAQMEDGGHIWVTGINDQYLKEYETFQLAELTADGETPELTADERLMDAVDRDDFDGIILPHDFLGLNGEKITLTINHQDVTFTIYACVLSHAIDRMDAYVSRAYLEKQLGADGLYNTVFYMEEPEAVDMDHVSVSQTNEQIWEENYDHVVQGTETMELIFWMILICSIFAVCTCLVMSGFDNERNLAYLQGLGTGKKVLRKIYIFQVIWNVACTVLPVSFLTYIFAKGIGYLLLNPGYYQGKFSVNSADLTALFVVYLAVAIAMQLFMIKKATNNEKYIRVLRS